MSSGRSVSGRVSDRVLISALCLLVALVGGAGEGRAEGRWTESKAQAWYAEQPWLVGCNFIPSTAINQLEMWQADTFDPDTIDRELGWAASLGFNTVRVYLHDLLWQQDAEGFLGRLDRYLSIADRHGIGTMFVLFDGVWDPLPKLGPQPAPRPGVHNSGWVQSPHTALLRDPARHGELEAYVSGVVGRFRADARVFAWDLYNEPDNANTGSYGDDETENKAALVHGLLRDVFRWARRADPVQPLTVALWHGNWSSPDKMTGLDAFIAAESDIISFHYYGQLRGVQQRIEWLERYNRPIVCSEYMARTNGSTFESVLPYFKEERIGAINWGLVAGKTQTIYPWASWARPFAAEPEVWFHDIFRPDGTPFSQGEAALIRSLTGARPAQ